MALARERADAGVAVGVVLHDLGLAGAHCDRVTLLADGAVVRTGTPADVLRADLLSGVYGHPVEVLTHPRTGTPIVLARR